MTTILNKFRSPIADPLNVGTAVITRWIKNNPTIKEISFSYLLRKKTKEIREQKRIL